MGLQNCASEDLHGSILGVVLGEVLSELKGGVGVARDLLGKGLGRGEVGGVLFARDSSYHLIGLAKGNLGAKLQYTGGELVLGGESGGVEVDHVLVLAGVEGIVNVKEL